MTIIVARLWVLGSVLTLLSSGTAAAPQAALGTGACEETALERDATRDQQVAIHDDFGQVWVVKRRSGRARHRRLTRAKMSTDPDIAAKLSLSAAD